MGAPPPDPPSGSVRTQLLAAAGGVTDAQLEAMQSRVHQIETGQMW